MLCVICYHLHNLKNVKNTYAAVLLLIKLQALVVFHIFLNCINGTKSRKASQIFWAHVLRRPFARKLIYVKRSLNKDVNSSGSKKGSLVYVGKVKRK